MPKYLYKANYTGEGAVGLQKDGGTGRRAACGAHLAPVILSASFPPALRHPLDTYAHILYNTPGNPGSP